MLKEVSETSNFKNADNMVSITWHTKNTSPKHPFCHMYVVILCAHEIRKNEFSNLKMGGDGQKTMKPVPCTQTCVWQFTPLSYLSVYSRYWRSILAVYFGVYGRVLAVYTDSPPSNHATILINYPPPPNATTRDSPTHKHIVLTKEHHKSKAQDP